MKRVQDFNEYGYISYAWFLFSGRIIVEWRVLSKDIRSPSSKLVWFGMKSFHPKMKCNYNYKCWLGVYNREISVGLY